MKCEKTSADPAKHAGPFKRLHHSVDVVVGQCKACGNTYFDRRLTQEKLPSAKAKDNERPVG